MAYTKQTWTDLPDTSTPATATRMNHIEDGIKDNDTAIGTLSTSKWGPANIKQKVLNVTLNNFGNVGCDLYDSNAVILGIAVSHSSGKVYAIPFILPSGLWCAFMVTVASGETHLALATPAQGFATDATLYIDYIER